jgi:hypothetical protein
MYIKIEIEGEEYLFICIHMQLHRKVGNFCVPCRVVWFWFPSVVIDVVMEFNKGMCYLVQWIC